MLQLVSFDNDTRKDKEERALVCIWESVYWHTSIDVTQLPLGWEKKVLEYMAESCPDQLYRAHDGEVSPDEQMVERVIERLGLLDAEKGAADG